MAKKKVKRVKKNNKKENVFSKIISIIVLVFIAIFLFLSNSGGAGIVGDYIKKIVIALFGNMGMFFPILFLVYIAFVVINNTNRKNIISLLLLYICINSIVSLTVNGNIFDMDLTKLLNEQGSIERFEEGEFLSGWLSTLVLYGLYEPFGDKGSILILVIASIMLFLTTFSVEVIVVLVKFFTSVLFFIPRTIVNLRKNFEEDLEIEHSNEEKLETALSRIKKKNMKEDMETFDSSTLIKDYDNKNLIVPSKNISDIKFFEKNKIFSTDRIRIDAKDIQDRFFKVDDMNKYDNYNHSLDMDKEKIFNELKDKSINEIMHNNNVKSEDFFYTDNINSFSNKDIEIDDTALDFVEKVDKDTNIYKYDKEEDKEEDKEDKEENKIEVDDVKGDYEKSYNSEKIKNKELQKSRENTKPKYIKNKVYRFPPISYLNRNSSAKTTDKNYLNDMAHVLQNTLEQFGVGATVSNVVVGPTVTRFEIVLNAGVKVNKILQLQDDIKLAMAAVDIRIEAPIPGKSAIGIEVPNKETMPVFLGDIISTKEFKEAKSKLTVCIGRDIGGKVILCDLQEMPHLLVAGATGSGKSVCINSIIMSIIYKSSPEDVRLIMVDPKVVELQIYNDIPHLLVPVITDANKAAQGLKWAVSEMMRRYNLIVEKKLRDIDSYNSFIERENEKKDDEEKLEKLPKIVIIIDEFADLMMVASKEVEDAIFRIAQLARACGIYLVIATQRPSVNVISGSIKANVPGRIAFAVSSGVDSKTILDQYGAEKLLGKGDMLYSPSGIPKPIRVQGCYVSDQEIKKVVDFIKVPNYDEDINSKIKNTVLGSSQNSTSERDSDENDPYFVDAGKLCIEAKTASSGLLQRKLQIGFNRAARIIDQLENAGVVGPQDGKKPREILMTMEEFISNYGELNE